MDKFEVFLERVENNNSARETIMSHNDGRFILRSRMWNEHRVSPEYIYNGYAEVRFVLDVENTESFFEAVRRADGIEAGELSGINRAGGNATGDISKANRAGKTAPDGILEAVERRFCGDPREGYFYDNLARKIEDIIDRKASGIKRERAYRRAAEENRLPDYRKLANPAHKFEVFCLLNGVEYNVEENGNGDYYNE
jgi:hypothetical protein